jgi:hypothetical protein
LLEDRRMLDGIPGNGIADFTYDAGTGEMWVDTDGVADMTSLVIEGPKATNVDPWGNWYATFDEGPPSSEQWLMWPEVVPEGTQHIATYGRGLTGVDFQEVIYATDAGGIVHTDVQVVAAAAVVDRHVFYNNSAFDAGAGKTNDDAVATDKTALLPGQTATFDNYTSYSRGINGVMVDISDVPGTVTASDFEFRVGNHGDPSTWATAPNPQSVTLRRGDGTGASDRVTIIWANGAIANQWLQVTVLASARTGLAADDVFYFGNAVGEAGDSDAHTLVNATDQIFARNHPTGSADVEDPHDYNRDGEVDNADELVARGNQTDRYGALVLLQAPEAPGAGALGAAPPEQEVLLENPTWVYQFEPSPADADDPESDDPIAQAVDKLLASYYQ